MPSDELLGKVDRQLSTLRPFGREQVVAERRVQFEAENHMVERDPGIDADPDVEVDHLIDRVRRRGLADVLERTAVADRVERRSDGCVETEELADPLSIEPLALLGAVLAGAALDTVDDRLRNQHPVVRARIEDLVCVQIVALSDPVGRSLFALEVEARIDLILAIREVEPHQQGTAW